MKHKILIILLLSFFCNNISADESGYYKGKHWRVYGSVYWYLSVDGRDVLSAYDYIVPFTIGDSLYFKASLKHERQYKELYNIEGEKVIPYKFINCGGVQLGKGHFILVRRHEDGPEDMFTVKGKLVVSNWKNEDLGTNYIKRKTDSKYGEIFLVKAKDENNRIKQGLFTTSGDCIIPVKYKSLKWTTDDDDNIATFEVTNDNDYIGIMDRDKNWIVPLSKQFTKVTPSEISWKKYFICMRKGYWGLYDAQFNEVIAPDYEGLEVLDETNFIKFRLNGFWGVMTLQANTNTTKTIIPTTRGYTSIGRYIKSQKRFTYTMNGYRGECNHLGQQVSKIKVATPKPSTTVASSSSSSSSSSRASSSSSSTSSTSSSSSSSSSSNTNGKQTIVIEHHRDPVPVQVWKQCTICFGSGKCQTCGGTGIFTGWSGNSSICEYGCGGSGKCSFCAGHGGHYEVEYR